jgi:ElaB/YqjD/DUF883 family membrane-anchored ribosome-binding protein
MADTLASEIAQDVGAAVARAMRRVSAEAAHLSRDAHRAADRTHAAGDHLVDELADDARAHGRRLAQVATREAREHPVTMIAVGAALGAFAGAFLARRR